MFQSGPEGEVPGAGGSAELGANPTGEVVDFRDLRGVLRLLDLIP